MADYYQAEIKCQNCRKPNYVKIPVGITILEYAKEKENPSCKNCGCPIIKIKAEKEEKD